MEIIPYIRSPDEEFTSIHGNRKWAAALMWQWSGAGPDVRVREFTKDKLLRDCIQIRRDTDQFGFIYNRNNGIVLYADMEAIEHVTKHLNDLIITLKQQEPQILKDLRIAI